MATRAQAQSLARSMVAQRLAVCVQISEIASVYRWQGAVHEEAEYRLSCKTTVQRQAALLAALRVEHPYELPQLQVLAVVDTDAAYAAWVEASVDPNPL